ncbi:lysophospholipase [Burkholderiales bacterium JOSHI_001]|nr:lysophospholipase [Burkholderiales bacterium JOSHI_001]
MPDTAPYRPRVQATECFLPVRGLRYHLHTWGDPAWATPERPALVLVHGWMDVAASWQFMVDALAAQRYVVAPDWRGFGQTQSPGVDSYWFADYLGDLDALLDQVSPNAPVDLVGHSMGGNVVMIYAGVRPGRIRRLVNLEGFGLPDMKPAKSPRRLAEWLDELKLPQSFRPYDSAAEVPLRLMKTHPGLTPDRAAWLAPYWAAPDAAGQWQVRGDPAHKRVNPILYRVEEVLAAWQQISAPVLWVEGSLTDMAQWWKGRYTRDDFEARLRQVPRLTRRVLEGSAHMMQFDQPQALAACLEAFLDAAPG